MAFMRRRAARVKDGTLCAVDSTTRRAWGTGLSDSRWGRGKEGPIHRQSVEVVVYALDDHMPIYYQTFPGNMPDSRTLESIISDLHSAGLGRRTVLITDRGYETLAALRCCMERGQPWITASKVT